MHQLFHSSDQFLFIGLMIVTILLQICILVAIEGDLYFFQVNKQDFSSASLTLPMAAISFVVCSFQKRNSLKKFLKLAFIYSFCHFYDAALINIAHRFLWLTLFLAANKCLIEWLWWCHHHHFCIGRFLLTFFLDMAAILDASEYSSVITSVVFPYFFFH